MHMSLRKIIAFIRSFSVCHCVSIKTITIKMYHSSDFVLYVHFMLGIIIIVVSSKHGSYIIEHNIVVQRVGTGDVRVECTVTCVPWLLLLIIIFI